MSTIHPFTFGKETDNLYFQYIQRTQPFEKSNHYHAYYEIYYLLHGQRTYFIKDRSYLIESGDLIFINKNVVHKTSDHGKPGHERILINFNDAFLDAIKDPAQPQTLLQPFLQPVHVIRLKLQQQIFVRGLLTKLAQELKERDTGFELMSRNLVTELLLFTVRHIERNAEVTFEHASPLHHKISEIVQYINLHYSEALSLAQVSSEFFISQYYMSRAFKEVTGFTIIEYVNVKRMKEAERLLIESNLKVIEIANLVGFENTTHFGRVFKQTFGLTPMQFRKLKRVHK